MFDEGVRRLLLRIAAVSFTIAALVGIATLIGGDGGYEQERIGYSAALVSAMALVATPGVVLLDQLGRSALWSAVGGITLVFSMLVLTLGLLAIWTEAGDDDEVIGVIIAVALTGSHTSLLTIGRRERDTPGVRALISATISVGAALGAFVCVAILAELDGEGTGRAIAVFGVLDALGLVLIPIARRLQGADARPSASPGSSSPTGARGGLQLALGLDPSGSREGRLWELDPAGFEAALRRAEGLGLEPLVADAVPAGGGARVAVLRERGAVVVLTTAAE